MNSVPKNTLRKRVPLLPRACEIQKVLRKACDLSGHFNFGRLKMGNFMSLNGRVRVDGMLFDILTAS